MEQSPHRTASAIYNSAIYNNVSKCSRVSLRLQLPHTDPDRKSTRLNSSHRCISYAVFCLKKNSSLDSCADPQSPSRERAAPTWHSGGMRASAATDTMRFLIFFFKNTAPPESHPFPLPAAFPT